jgi:hypothetical protein
MTEPFETTRVLITVMTYPHPSQKYNELLCTGESPSREIGCVSTLSITGTGPRTSSSGNISG